MNFPRAALFLTLAVGQAGAEDDAHGIARYLGYRKLTRLTAEKQDPVEASVMMCRDPKQVFGPHFKPGIHLYANAMALSAKGAPYPLGSLIVKEKFPGKHDGDPNLITVMEKTGNTGRIEDWKFVMIRLSDRSIIRDGFKTSCTDCHSRYEKSDFISPTTAGLLEALRKPPAAVAK